VWGGGVGGGWVVDGWAGGCLFFFREGGSKGEWKGEGQYKS
jgi:hypothetical protein